MLVEAGLTIGAVVIAAKLLEGRRGRRGGRAVPDRPSQQSPVTISDRVMRGPTGATYTLTDDDLLWLARAIYGEAGTRQRGGAAVAWALAQNMMLVGREPPRITPFSRLVRSYCQPVNPAWADPNGEKCRRHPEACTPQKIARRAQITGMAWASIPASVRDTVIRFAAGTLPNEVPGLVDWATPRWAADNVEIDGNFFGRNPNRIYAA